MRKSFVSGCCLSNFSVSKIYNGTHYVCNNCVNKVKVVDLFEDLRVCAREFVFRERGNKGDGEQSNSFLKLSNALDKLDEFEAGNLNG